MFYAHISRSEFKVYRKKSFVNDIHDIAEKGKIERKTYSLEGSFWTDGELSPMVSKKHKDFICYEVRRFISHTRLTVFLRK